jgi:hypothetical protein
LATPRLAIARFSTTDAAIQTLTLTGGGSAASTMTWLRSGAGPEVSRVTFEWSEDGAFYSLFGSGARVTGGWQVTGTNLPNTLRLWVRARGYYSTGFQTGSGSIVESILIQAPLVASHDGDFDGDGKADITIYRPSSGTWWVLRSGANYTTYGSYAWGVTGDLPVRGDFDGDGKTDIAAYRPSNGTWYILLSGANYTTFGVYQWGAGGDVPLLERP